MPHRIFILIASLMSAVAAAHAAPVHHWSQRFGNTSTDQRAHGIAVDDVGNVFIAGDFLSTINFGGSNLNSVGAGDVFVASFDADGDHRWSARFGDANPNQVANAIATDGSGNVFVTGNHWGTVNFGGSNLASLGGDDVFLVKFDNDGDHLWSKRFGDASTSQTGRALAITNAGEVVIGGSFLGTIDFGNGTLSSLGGLDLFVAKFAANGSIVWSKRFGGINDQYLESVAVDNNGAVAVCGYYAGTVDLGGGALPSAIGNDIFLAKLDSDGDHVWSKSFGGANDQEGTAVAVGAGGAIFAGGRFEQTVNFGGSTLTSSGGHDVFIAQFTSAGAHSWSKRFGSSLDQTATSLAVDDSGNFVAVGNFASTIDFGGGTLTNNGSDDVFVARFSSDGSHVWSASFGGTSDQHANAVAIDASERTALAGEFFGTIDFGGGTLTSDGGGDVFVAQFGDPSPDPVFITAFAAVAIDDGVEVRWQLWSDEALDGFTLYRRDANTPFAVIAEGLASHGAESVIDRDARPGSTYTYLLVVRTSAGTDLQSQEVSVRVPGAIARLTQNHPNPFATATHFELTIDESGPARVGVYDVAGRRVRLLDGGVRAPGTYRFTWDGRDAHGKTVANGVYFYRLEGTATVAARRMLLIR